MTKQEEELITEHNYQQIALNRIRPDPDNPRRNKDAGDGSLGDLEELRESIESRGLQVALIVEEIGTNLYQIVDGERRYTVLKQSTKDPSSVFVSCDVRPRLGDFEKRRLRIELDQTHKSWSMAIKIATVAQLYKSWKGTVAIQSTIDEGGKQKATTASFAKLISISYGHVAAMLLIASSKDGWDAILNGKDFKTAYEMAQIEKESQSEKSESGQHDKHESLNRLSRYGSVQTNPEYGFAAIEEEKTEDKEEIAYSRADFNVPWRAAAEAGKVRREVKMSKINPDKASKIARHNITKTLDKFGLYYTSITDQIRHLENARDQELVRKSLERHIRISQKIMQRLEKKVRTGT